MHQLLCGVNDAVLIEGCRVQVLEISAEVVRLGLSMPGNDRIVREITLPSLVETEAGGLRGPTFSRPTFN